MSRTIYTYLKFVRYKDIVNWSVSHILGINMGFNEEYPMVPIGYIIKRNTNSIDIEDNVSYKQITLKTNGGGAVLRDIKQGKNIGTKKQYVVSAGQFIMSKIDARNGAFGVVGINLDGAVVTADFPVFDVVKEKVTPEYLTLISSTSQFVRFAQSCSRGTTNRQRIDVNLFLSQKIPLPSLDEQQSLVTSYNNKIQQADALESQSVQIEKDIENYLLTELGIRQEQKGYKLTESAVDIACEPQVEYVISNHQISEISDAYHWGDEIKKEYKYLKFVRFKDVERWDVPYFSQKSTVLGKYKNISMGKCIDNFMKDNMDNPLRIETYKHPNECFQYIGMEDIEKKTGTLIEEKIVKGISIKSQTVRVPQNYFIYGKLRPYLNKYWYNESDNGNIVCSSEFFVFSIKQSINPYYFKYYLSSCSVQQQISSAFRGARMPRINEETFKAIEVPIPPIDIQNSIVEHINEKKEQIKQMKQQAEKLRKEALEDFEKEIFE